MKNIEKHKKIVATLCYIQTKDKSKTLMLLRNKKENDVHKGKYNGLGGKSEEGEDPYSCVIREVKEEAGVNIKPIYVGNITFEGFANNCDWEVHIFRTEGYEGNLKECNEGELIWVNTNKLLELNLWDGDKIFLKYLNKKAFFIGNFKYNKGKLEKYKIILPQMN